VPHNERKQLLLQEWQAFADRHRGVISKLLNPKKLSQKRNEKTDLRLADPNFDIPEIFKAIEEQIRFLTGDNSHHWRVSYDWLIENDLNFVKILERKYLSGDDIRKIIEKRAKKQQDLKDAEIRKLKSGRYRKNLCTECGSDDIDKSERENTVFDGKNIIKITEITIYCHNCSERRYFKKK